MERNAYVCWLEHPAAWTVEEEMIARSTCR
jgi:hypothetical protein